MLYFLSAQGTTFINDTSFVTDSLRYTSALSVALAVVFVVITAGVAIVRLIQGTVEIPKLFPDIDGISSVWKLFTAVPVLVTAYICHYNGASPNCSLYLLFLSFISVIPNIYFCMLVQFTASTMSWRTRLKLNQLCKLHWDSAQVFTLQQASSRISSLVKLPWLTC